VTLNLDAQQSKQAEEQLQSADGTVRGRIPEAYQWLLVPTQTTPQSAVEWQSYRLNGQESLAVRASNRLRNEELLVPALAGTRLRMELDRVPLWRGDSVSIKQLAEDFARYLYLPRLTDPQVLSAAINDGLGLLLWNHEAFAYADSFDETAGRYRGLRCGQHVALSLEGNDGLLVKPEAALIQQAAEVSAGPANMATLTAPTVSLSPPTEGPSGLSTPTHPSSPKRFHGTVSLDPKRVGRDAGRIADEVISHLEGLMGSNVTVTLEIDARIPDGAPENLVRIVTENSRTLKFTSQGFEDS